MIAMETNTQHKVTVRCHRRQIADRPVMQCRRPATYMVVSGGLVLPACSTCAVDFPVHWLIGSELQT